MSVAKPLPSRRFCICVTTDFKIQRRLGGVRVDKAVHDPWRHKNVGQRNALGLLDRNLNDD